MERYPRSKQLWKEDGKSKIFNFNSLAEYEAKQRDGWVFNPADLKKKKIEAVNEDIQEEKAEETPEPLIHRPSVPGTPDIEPVEPLQCKLCDFKGKNALGLRMHKLHKHKEK